MTTRKRWPNNAENARIEALANARKGLNVISPALDRLQDPESLRVVAVANDCLHRIVTELISVGPTAE